MPAHRKPASVLKSTGAMAHDPSRYRKRKDEPAPSASLGPAPGHLSKAHAAIWTEIASLALPGVLGNADRLAVELACRLTHKMRTGRISTGETSQLVIVMGKLGMTPADRSKVHGSKPEETDEWDLFATVQ